MNSDIFDLRFAFLSPVMAAGEEDNEEDEVEDEDNENEPDDQDTGQRGGRNKDEYIRSLKEEAKKNRLKAKDLSRQLREKEKAAEAQAEKEKPEIDRLKSEIEKLKPISAELNEVKIRNIVLEKAIEYKVSGDVDFLEFKLRKKGLLKLDEEGDLPDEFEDAVKALAKEMRAESEKEPAESGDDRSDKGEKPAPTPKSPRLGGKKKQGKDESDVAVMAKRFPALTQRSAVP
jgi:hypothetical protein